MLTEHYCECAGIKLLGTEQCLIADNRIEDISGGCGLWQDWDNKGSRATNNRISRINGFQGGIFLEASNQPNLIDHNVIEDIDGPGIFGGDSSNQLYLNNWVAPAPAPASTSTATLTASSAPPPSAAPTTRSWTTPSITAENM